MITSLTNAKIKTLVLLRTKAKVRNNERLMVAEGFRIFEEAPVKLIREIYIEENALMKLSPSAKAKVNECKARGVFTETVSREVMLKASDTDSPQGIIFTLSQPHYSVKDIISNVPPKDKGNILILENIQDPGNLGTMMRTAEAAGVSGVILSKDCVDIFNPKTVRSTMGALFRVPFVYSEDLKKDIETLKKNKVTIYAAALDAKDDYDKIAYEGRSGILIGNEGNGLSKEMVDISDTHVIIPMSGQIESLNAAVAAALLLYRAK